jgi:2-amino-4-hydroxy-6-hydroxymethyldihydropteridine diphosphokinase
METKVFLGLGSNLGNKLKYLRKAVRIINECSDCKVKAVSSICESKPFGNYPHDLYYNAVIEIETTMPPDDLLMFTQFVERFTGRKPAVEKWAPREIDVDILFYNQLIYNYDDLIIPHPEILKRDFVLVPLIEIDNDFVHPVIKKKLSAIDISKIEKNIMRKLDYSLM